VPVFKPPGVSGNLLALPLYRSKIRKKTTGEAAMGIEILALAAGVYALTWFAVLVGSRFFGPR
jgi:hypothetical protein